MKTLILGLITALGLSMPALAQVSEIRIGAQQHDIEFFGLGGKKGKETSAAINAEIIFEEPEFLKWALSPQPYIGGSLNLEGNTSYGGAGLMWRQTLGDKFYFDFAFGLVGHTGTKEVPLPSYFDDPAIVAALNGTVTITPAQLARIRSENVPYFESLNSEIEFGSRILFREALTLGLRVTDRWATEVYVEHLSNGKILTNGSNEGLDVLGGRLSYRFD
ncbi:MAG: acyloxyacyl hydrolase [Litorimonas sp.]